MGVVELEFRAMASEGLVQVVDGGIDLARAAVQQAQDLEARWSRFLPDSDIARLNVAGGQAVDVAPETITLVTTMTEAWALTGHRFDPTLLPALVELGYGASIDDPGRRSHLLEHAEVGGDLRAIDVDTDRCTITLPPGMTLDPGGVGKGLAADLVVTALRRGGAAGALVSLGGDISLAGRAPSDEWLVIVESPQNPRRELCTLAVADGGVATSSTLSRRWNHAGTPCHHLIDPLTGRPAATDLLAVTVVASTAWEAEAIATAAVLAGSAGVRAVFEAHSVDGIAVTDTGATISTITSLNGDA